MPSSECPGLQTSRKQKGQVPAQQEAQQGPLQDPLLAFPTRSRPAVPGFESASGWCQSLHGPGLMQLRAPGFFPHSGLSQGSAQRLRCKWGPAPTDWVGRQEIQTLSYDYSCMAKVAIAMEPDIWSLEARKGQRRLDLTLSWSEGQGQKDHFGL